jgi:hypothetical protein
MTPTEWLEQNAFGFSTLAADERSAIADFSFLWSFFEAVALGSRASPSAIVTLTGNLSRTRTLDFTPFRPALHYFQHRYFGHAGPTEHYADLHFRANDRSELVQAVLSGQNTSEPGSIAALLLIVYRLRNNLFHGAKWAYGIHGQLDNFTQGNQVLMNSLNMVAVL